MDVRIASTLLDRALALAAADRAREICGLLLGSPGRIAAIVPAANVHPHPETRFELDPGTHFAALRAARAGGSAVIGHYHSHPGGLPEPSATDAAQALEPGQLWLILADGTARLHQVSRPGTFRRVRLIVDDPGGCASAVEPPQGPPSARRAFEDRG